jgi:hypothetical protein
MKADYNLLDSLQLTGDSAAIHYQVKDNEDADDSENKNKTIQAN